MQSRMNLPLKVPFFLLAVVIHFQLSADATFDKLYSEKKYEEALDYADEKISVADRDVATWIKIGEANNQIGRAEKALACYLVSWRMNPGDYHALLGVARAYNRLGQAENALDMAQKALSVNFTAEASWEYAQACITLRRPAEAKKAMEKVLQTDSSNVIAARELANIYFNEGNWSSAVPVLKRTYRKNVSGELAFQIGKAYAELGVSDSAIVYLKIAQSKGWAVQPTARSLAHAYYLKKKYGECAKEYGKVSSDSLMADHLYEYGIALEKTGGSAAADEYFSRAVDRYGNSVSPNALRAKEKTARMHVARKNFDTALQLLETIIAADPKGNTVAEGYFLLAEVYSEKGDTKSAIASLEKAIEVNSRNVEAYARLADLYQNNGMGEKAKKTFEVLMGLSPDDPRIYLALGNYNLKSSRYAEALQQFEKSAQLKKSAEAKEGCALAALKLKKYDYAAKAAEAACKLDKRMRGARSVLAQVHLHNKNYSSAIEQYTVLLKSEPENSEYLTDIAYCYEKAGKTGKLAEMDKKIARINPRNTESRLRLASYFESINNSEEAIRYYRELERLIPDSTFVLRRLGLLLQKKGDIDDAVRFTQRYIAMKGNDAEAHRDLGDLFYQQKKLDNALVEYRLALKLDPQIKGFYKRYAEIVIAKGEQDEVIKALSGVVDAGNADAGTFMTLGLMYQKKKEFTKAIGMYQKALMAEPSNFDALTALASCQAAHGETNNAIVTYEQAVMMNSSADKELHALGELYEKTGRTDEAIATYRKYLSIDSSDHELAQKVGAYCYSRNDDVCALRYLGMARKKLGPEYAVKFADLSMKTGKTYEALEVLLPLKPDKTVKGALQVKVYKMVAQALEKNSDTVAAVKAYGDYVQLERVDDRDASFRYATLLERSNPVSAQKVYEMNCRKYPDDYRNYLQLGLLYSQKKESLSKAIPLFNRVTVLADSIPSVWLELGKIYRQMGNEDEELNAYRRYAEFDPQNVEANRQIGVILIRKGQFNEGIVFLEIASTVKPDDPDVMTALARGYLNTNRSDEAVALLEKAKKKNPDDPGILFELFKLYQKSGQKQKAQAEVEALLNKNRSNEYLLLYAEALVIQEKFKEAAEVVEEILATDPENISTLLLKGKILRAQKQYDEAVEIYKEISFIDQKSAVALLERAETHMEQSKPQWAESFYKRALRLDSKLGRAELGLAKLAKFRKDMAGYRTHLESARRLDPDDELIQKEFNASVK